MCTVGTLIGSAHHAAHIREDLQGRSIQHTDYQYLVNLHHQHRDTFHGELGQKNTNGIYYNRDNNDSHKVIHASMQEPT